MSKQGVLSYRMEQESASANLTGLAGLAPYVELACGSGLVSSIHRNLNICDGNQGWTDTQNVMSLILLNLAGGECVDDLDELNSDDGFGKLLRRSETYGLGRRVRREMAKRWRKARTRNVVSASVARRYLSQFHDESQEELRMPGKALIPRANENLAGLRRVNSEFLAWMDRVSGQMVATLDLDATLIETSKKEALYSYKGYKAYQPLNVWWAEQGVMLHSEFRDGNVPAGYEQLRVLKEALSYLPGGVRKVRLRSDTAGYEHRLLRYLATGANERFGRIDFAISSDVTEEFKKAVQKVNEGDWQPLYKQVNGEEVITKREWAEVCFVPDPIAFSKNAPVYRYLATREELAEPALPSMEGLQPALPFPTMNFKGSAYKVFGVVTNLDWYGGDVIHFHDGRCGKCEEAHKVLKEDFAGGTMPSSEFGANAAWWAIAVLAMNLAMAMNRVVLGGAWANRRMKAIRFLIICIPGRFVEKARQLYLRLSRGRPTFELLRAMRERICELAASPPLIAL